MAISRSILRSLPGASAASINLENRDNDFLANAFIDDI